MIEQLEFDFSEDKSHTMPEMLPCPKCGGTRYHWHDSPLHDIWSVECANLFKCRFRTESIPVNWKDVTATRVKLAKMWNEKVNEYKSKFK